MAWLKDIMPNRTDNDEAIFYTLQTVIREIDDINLSNDGFNATTFEVQNKYTETSFLFVIQRLASPAKG